jgi:serine/threonine protein kinase
MSDTIDDVEGTLYPLWITNDWYIPVNKDGYVRGECAEGALGFVIKLHHLMNPELYQALKVPRLMGDTYRENAYIADLTEKELWAVREVFGRQGLGVGSLLQAYVVNDDYLRGPISTARSGIDPRRWDGALVLVNFKKGENPRFCLIKKIEDKIQSYPFTEAPISVAQYDAVIKESTYEGKTYQKTVFIVNRPAILTKPTENSIDGQSKDVPAAEAFSADQALDLDPAGSIWYAGVPSIAYGWAPITLQQSISIGDRGKWSARHHLELIEQICSGLRTLHTLGMLHADVRPANIVVQGPITEPASYKLADYGSFAHQERSPSRNVARSTNRTAQSSPVVVPHGQQLASIGGTQIGPVVVGERASAFYAPERRIGREREASDIAVIMDETPTQRTIVLGWKSDLLDKKTKLPNEEKLKGYIAEAREVPALDESKGTVLEAGDRIQIRDYIFELTEGEKRLEDKQIFVCKHTYWVIFHGRIAIESNQNLGGLRPIPVPRTIELLRWSVSTDLYSLGALTLYSVFRYQPEHKLVGKQVSGSDVEDQFREMLTYLTSVSFFNAIWPDLEKLRDFMEQRLDNRNFTAQRVVSGDDAARFAQETFENRPEDNAPVSLKAAAIEVTKRITQTTPGVSRLVEALDFNVAEFIFLFHFAFCCLHRQSHLRHDTDPSQTLAQELLHPDATQPDVTAILSNRDNIQPDVSIGRRDTEPLLRVVTPITTQPFCKNRGENPGPNGPATNALMRLEKLQRTIENPLLRDMKSDADTIGTYDPQPEISVRTERDQLLGDRQKLSAQTERRRKDLNILHNAVRDYKQELVKIQQAAMDINFWNFNKIMDKIWGIIKEVNTIETPLQQEEDAIPPEAESDNAEPQPNEN